MMEARRRSSFEDVAGTGVVGASQRNVESDGTVAYGDGDGDDEGHSDASSVGGNDDTSPFAEGGNTVFHKKRSSFGSRRKSTVRSGHRSTSLKQKKESSFRGSRGSLQKVKPAPFRQERGDSVTTVGNTTPRGRGDLQSTSSSQGESCTADSFDPDLEDVTRPRMTQADALFATIEPRCDLRFSAGRILPKSEIAAMCATAAYFPAVEEVMRALVSNRDSTSTIYMHAVDQDHVGLPYRQLARRLLERGAIPLGILRKHEPMSYVVAAGPAYEATLNDGDALYVLADVDWTSKLAESPKHHHHHDGDRSPPRSSSSPSSSSGDDRADEEARDTGGPRPGLLDSHDIPSLRRLPPMPIAAARNSSNRNLSAADSSEEPSPGSPERRQSVRFAVAPDFNTTNNNGENHHR
mmetsp:Transcript_3224/g.9882  ORF Transcript_3224/g.9882 Transcript_3224/m.9882 type:complete len:408 (-) Transcript_3224:769-1992(-)